MLTKYGEGCSACKEWNPTTPPREIELIVSGNQIQVNIQKCLPLASGTFIFVEKEKEIDWEPSGSESQPLGHSITNALKGIT